MSALAVDPIFTTMQAMWFAALLAFSVSPKRRASGSRDGEAAMMSPIPVILGLDPRIRGARGLTVGRTRTAIRARYVASQMAQHLTLGSSPRVTELKRA